MTVVFDAGQNSEDNFAHLASAPGCTTWGRWRASDCPDLTALPASVRSIANEDRFGGLTAYDTRREVYGADRRTILTHSPELRESQARGFDGTTLAKAGKKLDELAATLARGKTRRGKDKVDRRDRRPSPPSPGSAAHHLAARRRPAQGPAPDMEHRPRRPGQSLEEELFGKHVLITSHDDWPVPEVVAGYRSQSEAEFSFRQMKDTRVVSFSPMHHWTEHNIRVHVFTCVLALQIAHLMRLRAAHTGLRMSVRELLRELAGIGETVLLYHGGRGGPKAHHMLTETSPAQDKLAGIFGLARYDPGAEISNTLNHPRNHSRPAKTVGS